MTAPPLGRYAYGVGVMALGVACLATADFVVAQPLPKDFAHRAALAFAAAAFLLVTGAAIEWRRTVAHAAAALVVFYAAAVALVDGPALVASYAVYATYSGIAEQVAIMAAALIVHAASANIDPSRAARMTRIGQVVFGLCALLFGGAHFVYIDFTVPWVPKYLPPSQAFWAYATGVAHIAAGLAILTGVQARLAAILLTIMYASFTPLVHLPMLLAHPASHANWSENAINLALTGVAWVVADSLARAKR